MEDIYSLLWPIHYPRVLLIVSIIVYFDCVLYVIVY